VNDGIRVQLLWWVSRVCVNLDWLVSGAAVADLQALTSPSQLSRLASMRQASRMSRISSSLARCAGSDRRSELLWQACSWAQGECPPA
jgi:hypothetical protein